MGSKTKSQRYLSSSVEFEDPIFARIYTFSKDGKYGIVEIPNHIPRFLKYKIDDLNKPEL